MNSCVCLTQNEGIKTNFAMSNMRNLWLFRKMSFIKNFTLRCFPRSLISSVHSLTSNLSLLKINLVVCSLKVIFCKRAQVGLFAIGICLSGFGFVWFFKDLDYGRIKKRNSQNFLLHWKKDFVISLDDSNIIFPDIRICLRRMDVFRFASK